MFFIAYTFKTQVHVFAGRVRIVSHLSCRTSAILKYFCPLITIPGTLFYHCHGLLPHPLHPARHVINPTNKELLKLIHQEWTLIRYFWPHLKNKTTVKPVLRGHSKIVKTKILKTIGSLMKVESIAECSLGAFCNTFELH